MSMPIILRPRTSCRNTILNSPQPFFDASEYITISGSAAVIARPFKNTMFSTHHARLSRDSLSSDTKWSLTPCNEPVRKECIWQSKLSCLIFSLSPGVKLFHVSLSHHITSKFRTISPDGERERRMEFTIKPRYSIICVGFLIDFSTLKNRNFPIFPWPRKKSFLAPFVSLTQKNVVKINYETNSLSP